MATPASPYSKLMTRHARESLQTRAAAFAGFCTVPDDKVPEIPERMLKTLAQFARDTMKMCIAYEAMEQLFDRTPPAVDRDAKSVLPSG